MIASKGIPYVENSPWQRAEPALQICGQEASEAEALYDGECERSFFIANLENAYRSSCFEVINQYPAFILNYGNKLEYLETLVSDFRSLLVNCKVVFLLGVASDMDYQNLITSLIPLAHICPIPPDSYAILPEKLAVCPIMREEKTRNETDVSSGIRAALSVAGEDGVIVAMGSPSLIDEVRCSFDNTYRRWLRQTKINMRDALNPQKRKEKSQKISNRIFASEDYQRAKNIMLYKHMRGEVQLSALEDINTYVPEAQKKRFLYPVCIENHQMLAVAPNDPNPNSRSWKRGIFEILEPNPAHGTIVPPEEIDLVICPCASFDKHCYRLGMGGGYYDRFLPSCSRAKKIAVAFEEQRSRKIPIQAWDVPMDAIFAN